MREIDNTIKNGLENGYRLYCDLKPNESDLHSKIAEYVFTVSIAQSLFNWKNSQRDKYYIVIEKSAREFVNEAFPFLKQEWDFNDLSSFKSFIRKVHLPSRSKSGRIDIAISKAHDPNPLSFIGIEIKSINPPKRKINSDIARLFAAIKETDATGNNSIRFCYVVFLKRLDKNKEILTEECYNNRLQEYGREISELLSEYNNDDVVEVTNESFDLWKFTDRDYLGTNPGDDITNDDVVANTGAILGALIKLRRR